MLFACILLLGLDFIFCIWGTVPRRFCLIRCPLLLHLLFNLFVVKGFGVLFVCILLLGLDFIFHIWGNSNKEVLPHKVSVTVARLWRQREVAGCGF